MLESEFTETTISHGQPNSHGRILFHLSLWNTSLSPVLFAVVQVRPKQLFCCSGSAMMSCQIQHMCCTSMYLRKYLSLADKAITMYFCVWGWLRQSLQKLGLWAGVLSKDTMSHQQVYKKSPQVWVIVRRYYGTFCLCTWRLLRGTIYCFWWAWTVICAYSK